ncbi:bifunctional polynucleotide phosphatase/kinase [Anaeramoeba flamelloides]|uniref:Bifunctional polynucleotide phosphatase/kinase n=1 Tax=Anaeramoeba flamelloides TaxID=1746091 RepID=A0AAV7Z7X5_9EUKA|nr:bifunctional polynucleotide phosphatase/kinase [Anaeramoeba flamelloides]
MSNLFENKRFFCYQIKEDLKSVIQNNQGQIVEKYQDDFDYCIISEERSKNISVRVYYKCVDNGIPILKPSFLTSSVKHNSLDIANDHKNTFPSFAHQWIRKGTLRYLNYRDPKPSTKIFGFDFDSTLIMTRSGAPRSLTTDDWQIYNGNVIGRLKQLLEEGWKLVIFTNQGGVDRRGYEWEVSVHDRIGQFLDFVNLPIQVVSTCARDKFRKPSPFLFGFFEKYLNGKLSINTQESAYVGDAAGREGDYVTTDYKFARNIGFQFYVPEQLFGISDPPSLLTKQKLEQRPRKEQKEEEKEKTILERNKNGFYKYQIGKTSMRSFDPMTIKGNLRKSKTKYAAYTKKELSAGIKQEIIVLVGCPSCGKTTFYNNYFKDLNYTLLNHNFDDNSLTKCLDNNGSIVIESDKCLTIRKRRQFIEIAKSKKIPIRAFYFKATVELANHLNWYRVWTQDSIYIPSIIYKITTVEKPQKSEGFKQIKTISFRPIFENEKLESLFYLWTEELLIKLQK